MTRLILSFICFIGLLAGAPAEAAKYSFSDSGSKIEFQMKTNIHGFEGKAKDFKGSLDTDAGTGSLTIDASSLTTDNDGRDKKMHSFCLESGQYSEITFEVKSITGDLAGLQSGAGTGRVNLKGNLTIRGMYLEVSIPTDYSFEGEELTLKGSHRMSWTSYSVPDPSIPLIGKLDPGIKVKFKIKM